MRTPFQRQLVVLETSRIECVGPMGGLARAFSFELLGVEIEGRAIALAVDRVASEELVDRALGESVGRSPANREDASSQAPRLDLSAYPFRAHAKLL